MTDLSGGFDALGQTDTDQHPGQQQAASQLPFDPSQGVDPVTNVQHALTGEHTRQINQHINYPLFHNPAINHVSLFVIIQVLI